MRRRLVRVAGTRRPASSAPPGAPPQKERVDDTEVRTSRRKFLSTGGVYIAGIASGVIGSYGGAFLSAWVVPGELADAQSSEALVRAVVVSERFPYFQGELWVYPGALSQNSAAMAAVSSPAATWDEMHSRLYNHGFSDPGMTFFKLLVEGRRNVPVRVIDIRPILITRTQPPNGFSLLGPGAEGGGESIALGFNLDERIPVARKTSGGNLYDADFFREPYFDRATTQLARGEQQVYQITALTRGFDVEWTLSITVMEAGGSEPVVVEVRRGSRPFRTTDLLGNGTIEFTRYSEIYSVPPADPTIGERPIKFVRADEFLF